MTKKNRQKILGKMPKIMRNILIVLFLFIFSKYSKDSKNVYYETKKLDSADVETFEWIPYIFNQGYGSTGKEYAKDKNYLHRYSAIYAI